MKEKQKQKQKNKIQIVKPKEYIKTLFLLILSLSILGILIYGVEISINKTTDLFESTNVNQVESEVKSEEV